MNRTQFAVRTVAAAVLATAGFAAALRPCPAQESDDDRKEPALVTRIHDVTGLRPQMAGLFDARFPASIVPFGPSPTWAGEVAAAEPWDQEPGPDLNTLLELVAAGLPGAIAESLECETIAGGTALRVRAQEAAQVRVAAALESFRAVAGAVYELDVRAVRMGDGAVAEALLAEIDRAPGGVLPAALTARILAADARSAPAGGVVIAPAGRFAVFEQVATTPTVTDFNVEIAQDASIGDPIPTAVEEGLRAALRAAPLSDGRACVSVVAAVGEVTRLRRTDVRTTDLGSVELPDVAAAFAATEAVLARGETAAVCIAAPTGTDSASRHVVLVRLVAVPARPEVVGFDLIPVGGLTNLLPQPVLRARFDDLEPSLVAFGGGLALRWQEPTQRCSTDAVHSALGGALGSWLEREEGVAYDLVPDLGGGAAVVVRGGPGPAKTARDTIEAIERAAVRSAFTSIRFVETPLATTSADDAVTSGRTVGLLSGPVASGHRATFAAYRAAAYLGDYDVEVAEKARIADPIPHTAVGGANAAVRVAAGPGGAWRLDLSLQVSGIGDAASTAAQATEVGPVERIVTRRNRFDGAVTLAPGAARALDLGDSPWRPRGTARLWAVVRVQ